MHWILKDISSFHLLQCFHVSFLYITLFPKRQYFYSLKQWLVKLVIQIYVFCIFTAFFHVFSVFICVIFLFHFFDMLRMECRWLFCCAMLVMLRADWALRWSWGIFLIKFNHTNFDCGEPKLEKRFVACAAGEALHCFGIRDARNLCHGVIFF